MISAGIAVEGHGHGVHGLGPGPGPGPGPGGPYLPTYPAPLPSAAAVAAAAHDWRHKQEFLRPAPKINAGGNNRYNGSSAPLNGTRLLKYSPPAPHPATHLSSPPTTLPPPSLPSPLPVNLSAQGGAKEAPANHAAQPDDLASYYPRLYPPPSVAGVAGVFSGLYGGPYAGLYSGPYGQMVRVANAAAAAVGFVAPPPLSPLEHQYSPPASATSPHTPGGPAQGQGTFVTPAQTQFSAATRKELARERDREREREKDREREREREREKKVVQGFKVPCGKEGSLKHRILPRLDPPRSKHLPLGKPPPSNNNNTVVPGNFAKGSLIQLASGQLRRVEDMTTEDFVLSAERSPELRLAESTVVRVMEKGEGVVITLTYNQNRTQVEFEATVEHPFFVYGQGWASCSPDRTLQHYGLKVHRLQVGDILVSLTPREPRDPNATAAGTTYDLSRRETVTVTTATTTSMTARQVGRPSVSTAPAAVGTMPPPASQPPPCPAAPCLDSASRKRRWSAPDQITDEEQLARRPKE